MLLLFKPCRRYNGAKSLKTLVCRMKYVDTCRSGPVLCVSRSIKPPAGPVMNRIVIMLLTQIKVVLMKRQAVVMIAVVNVNWVACIKSK